MMRYIRHALFVTVALIAAPGAALAQSDIRLSADANAGVGYSNNPFSVATGNSGSALAEIKIEPRLRVVDEHSEITLSGTGDYQRYLRRYGDSFDWGGALDYSATPAEHVKTNLGVRYSSSIVGRGAFTSGATDPALPDPPIVSGTDIALFGTRDRVDTLRGNGDVTYAISARDTFAAGAYYVRSRYTQFGAIGDYDGYGGSLGYSRQVDEHLQLGLQGSAARYDYVGAPGDSTIYSAQLAFNATLGPRWTASGALGMTFIDANVGASTTSLSGNVRLCQSSARGNFCIYARRAALPTGITGVQNETSVGASYSYKLSERGRITASADYTRNGNGQSLNVGQNEYLRGSLGYDRVLSQRIHLFVQGQYRGIFGGPVKIGADYGGKVGLAIRFGDTR
ncbi:hypothetical protein BH11PSE5_BH11PSE5_11030 [soil metagenome]